MREPSRTWSEDRAAAGRGLQRRRGSRARDARCADGEPRLDGAPRRRRPDAAPAPVPGGTDQPVRPARTGRTHGSSRPHRSTSSRCTTGCAPSSTRLRDIVEQVVAGEEQAHRRAQRHQRADHAPEQLDARRLLRAVLPVRDGAPRHGGPLGLPAPAPERPRADPGAGPAGGGAPGHPRRPRTARRGPRRPGVRRVRTRPSSQRVVDRLSRPLLEHLAYEEVELVPALDRHGFY